MNIVLDRRYLALCRRLPIEHELQYGDWACWATPSIDRPNVAFSVGLDLDLEANTVWVPRLDQVMDLLMPLHVDEVAISHWPENPRYWECAGAGAPRLYRPLRAHGKSKEEAAYRLLLQLQAAVTAQYSE